MERCPSTKISGGQMSYVLERGSATGRAAFERRPIQIPDVLADPEYQMSEGQRAGRFL